MIKAVIIDDEADGREVLIHLIKRYCPIITISGTADSCASGLNLIQGDRPDLVFLDIEMPDENGFELLKKVGTLFFEVIFTTAYEQYALRAFKFSATDYLLKPVNPNDLILAVNKVKEKVETNKRSENINLLLENLSRPKELHNFKLALPALEGFVFVELKDIIRCESDSNYTTFFLSTKEKVVVSRTLKEYEDLLPQETFLRVHQSHLFNIKFIRKYLRGDTPQLIMEDGALIPVSRRKKEELLSKLIPKF